MWDRALEKAHLLLYNIDVARCRSFSQSDAFWSLMKYEAKSYLAIATTYFLHFMQQKEYLIDLKLALHGKYKFQESHF
jgi:hypothetical protein